MASPGDTLRERRAIAGKPMTAPQAGARAVETFTLPLSFEPNRGQASDEARFVGRGRGYTLILGDGGRASLAVRDPRSGGPLRLAVAPAGADPRARIEPLEPLPGVTSYFRGRNPERWLARLPTYAKVAFRQVYPGIDLLYYGREREFEFDFVVSPGADPGRIALRFEGAERLEVDAGGSLIVRTAGGELVQRPAIVYQEEADGRRSPVESAYVLASAGEVRFRLGPYDPARVLIIDPVLVYSTYLGGGRFDSGAEVAVDAQGNVYVTGQTASLDFPTASAFQGALANPDSFFPEDVFITKLHPSGSSIIYSTYLGGSSSDAVGVIAIDPDGNAYVAGATTSDDFPTTPGAFSPVGSGNVKGFVTKLAPSGSSLVYSTYLNGGSVTALAVDAAGYAYLAGSTTASALFTTTPGAFQPASGGRLDAFVTKLNLDGSSLVYSTFLGGGADDSASAIAIDAGGHAYVTGQTQLSGGSIPGPNFPVTPGAFFQGGGLADAFVTKLSADGSSLVYSAIIGGNRPITSRPGVERGNAIVVDASGAAYVTGTTTSSDFPTTPGAYLRTNPGDDFDAFVTKLDPSGSALSWSTYFGGLDPFSTESASAIALDAQGRVVIAGLSRATSFPTVPAGMCSLSSGHFDDDAFVAQFSTDGSTLVYADEIGGSFSDAATGIAIDAFGDAYVVGGTQSSDFPSKAAFQPHGALAFGFFTIQDAFIVKIALSDPTIETLRAYAGPDLHSESTTVTLDGSGSCGAANFVWTGPFAEGGGSVTGPTPTVTLPAGTHEIQLLVSNAVGDTSIDVMHVTVELTVPLFLHAQGTSLFLDTSPPMDAVADFRDSASLNFAGGNPWKEIGTWSEPATGSPQTLTALGDLHVWLGLKNSDDQGTRFDLQAEVLKNEIPIASGEIYCLAGITRNPANALEVSMPFGPIADAELGPADARSP
jgi:hypothetical protein